MHVPSANGTFGSRSFHMTASATWTSGPSFRSFQTLDCFDLPIYQIRSLCQRPLRRYEIRCKMKKIGWFRVVGGHSRSSAMSPFDRARTTSDSTFSRNYASLLYRFRDIASYLSNVADFNLPHLQLAPSLEFYRGLWRQKTIRVPGLSCGVVCVICLAILTQYRLVTDRETNRWLEGRTDRHRTIP